MRAMFAFFDGFHGLLVILAKILLVAMVVIISVNVFLRYVFNSGLAWSEEIALVLVVWFTFIAMAMGVKQGLHISLSILPEKLQGRLEFFLDRLTNLVVLFCGIVFLVYGTILTLFTMRSILPGTGLPAGFMYVIMPIVSVPVIFESLSRLLGFRSAGGEEGPHA